MRVYKLQEMALKGLLTRLTDYEKSGMGKVFNINIMTNADFETDVFIQYEVADSMSTTPVRDSNLWRISKNGELTDFKKYFPNPFDKYAFLGRCLIENVESIEVIDN